MKDTKKAVKAVAKVKNGNGKAKATKKHKATLPGFNENWLKENKWQPVQAGKIPADASDRTKKLLSIARKASKHIEAFRKGNMLRVRYGDLALLTIRAFTRETPTVTITPRLRDEKFSEVFKGTDSKAWKPTGAPPFDSELLYQKDSDPGGKKLVSRVSKILPVMIERAKES